MEKLKGTVIDMPGISAESLLATMAEGVIIIDPDGFIRSWNPGMEKISGYSYKMALGKHISWLKYDKCRGSQKIMELLEKKDENYRCKDEECITGCECFIKNISKNAVPVVVNARILRDSEHKFIGIIQTLSDFRPVFNLQNKIKELTEFSIKNNVFQNMAGNSKPMHELFRQIRLAADSDVTTLILGQSGVGKELVAKALHNLSKRAEMPFIKINCGALSEHLLESELFGHVRGAFTNAYKDKEGRFEVAHKGTLFLDEIGEISLGMQVKLLRVLQEGTYERVGENRVRKSDVRIIAATNRDLLNHVAMGNFREDLYYRLRVFPIYVPSLSERREDIPILAAYFISRFAEKTGKKIRGLSSGAMKFIMNYSWPGNVREFENAFEYSFVVSKGPEIDLNELPPYILNNPDKGNRAFSKDLSSFSVSYSHNSATEDKRDLSYEQKQASLKILKDPARLEKLLVECDWNKAEAGRRLKKSRTAVWKWMKKHNLPMFDPAIEKS